MANTITVEIVDADSCVYSGEGVIVSVSASQGEIGVMHGHAPLLSALKPGHVIVKHENGDEDSVYVSSGLVEVMPTKVSILADTAERAEDLDRSAIEEARKQAEDALRTAKGPDFKKAQQDLAEAAARLSLLNRFKP